MRMPFRVRRSTNCCASIWEKNVKPVKQQEGIGSAAFRWGALLLVGTAALLAAVAWPAGCRRSGAKATAGGDLVVWVTGDTRGYLEPCGCRRDQAGGLPARMTLISQDKAPNRLLLDVGNLTSGGRSYELLKLDYLLHGMALIGYDAVN